MKASQTKPPQTKNQVPIKNQVQSFGPSPLRTQNKSLLEKYSFQDNDLSRTSQLISDINQDEEEWLRLEIKEITSIGKQLITFYLAVKYLVEYQEDKLPNFDKQKTVQKHSQNLKQTKEVKSKLVHGSILQTEHKNLVLNLKCNKKSLHPPGTKPSLICLQFQIMRIFQTKNQPVLIAKQIINNPETNAEYEVAFQDINPPEGSKAKSVVAMIFEIGSAIQEQIDINDNSQSQNDSRNDQVSEHLDGEEDGQKYENYTLGKSETLRPSKPKKNQPNIFDTSNHEDSSQDNHGKFLGNPYQTQNQQSRVSKESSNTELICKLNQLSNMMDENLEKSKNQDQAYKNYLEETSNMIQQFQTGSGANLRLKTINAQNQNQAKSKQPGNNQKASLNQAKHNKSNQPIHQTQSQPQSQSPQHTSSPKQSTHIPKDRQPMDQRHSNVSKIESTYIAGQRFQYQSRINNNNPPNTDGEKYNYISQKEIANNYSLGDKLTTLPKGDDSNIVDQRYNYESSKMDQTNLNAEKYDQENKVDNSNILDQTNLNDLSAINPIQPNSPITPKKSSYYKKQPFLKFNSKKYPNQVKSRLNNEVGFQNQFQNRSLQFNMGDLDSSNIRYEYNDVSNIEETKNMQDLISQIQKIQKEWYEKRVLNRKNRQEKKTKNQTENEENKPNSFNLASNPDGVLDLELKNFKIKFSEQTFSRKLIDGLKSKHLAYVKRTEINQNKLPEIPQNYIVFLAASQVDDENMHSESENTARIQIKIPSRQIDKLIQLQSIEKQRSLSNSGFNTPSHTISKLQEKQIIKAFEKQIYSKVMKIKLSKNDKNSTGQKKITKIIEIALEDESLTLSSIQIDGTPKDPPQNRISLVGMYPFPIFGNQSKDSQTSFYQNVSIEPLEIEMYDTKTGIQEGQIKFELTKAKVDREIQTLEPLENIDEPQEYLRDLINQRINEENSSLLVGFEVHEDKKLNQGLSESKKSIKKSKTDSRLRQRILEVEILQSFDKQMPSNMKAQSKQQNRQLKFQSQASHNFHLQNEKLLKTSLNSDDNSKKSKSFRFTQPQDRQKNQEFTHVKENSQKINNPNEQYKNDRELLQLISKTRSKSINQDKNGDLDNKTQSPHKDKNVETIGKIIKNHPGSQIEINSDIIRKANEWNERAKQTKNDTTNYKKKLIPQLHMSNIRKVYDPNTSRKVQLQSPVKSYKTSSRPRQIFPNSPSSIHENHDPPSDSSYILMKQEFLATANLLESIKIKAQQYIQKVQSQRKIPTGDELHTDKEGEKLLESQVDSKVAYTIMIEKRAINLGVSSFVVNQTVLSRKQILRNLETIGKTPQTVPINPKAVSNILSKRTSTNKSRNSKLDSKKIQPSHNKFTVPHERQSESQQSIQNNHQKEVQSIESVMSIHERKSKRKQKPKKPLVYKEESDYQFTEEQGTAKDEKKYQNKPYLSSNKNLDVQQQSDSSNQLQFSGMNGSRVPSGSYPKGTLAAKKYKHNIKQSTISYLSQKVIEIKVFSLNIKLLSLPLVANHLRSLSQDLPKGKDYFVLVYTDFSEENRGGEDNLRFMLPVSQKCIMKQSGKENQLLVVFSDNAVRSDKGTTSEAYLLLRGVEKTKFFVQLYHCSQPIPISQKCYQKDLTSLEHISLITLSPQNKKSKAKAFASLSVTFIELLAQHQSAQFTSRLQRSDFITYSNFLYDKQKILAKININYITQLPNFNHQNNLFSNQFSKPMIPASRKQAIQQYKPSKNSYFKNHPVTKKNHQQQRINDLRQQRSESGMTKKLTPRRKMPVGMSEQNSQNERTSLPVKDSKSQADPLQILKRKVPKPIKSQEKGNKHSLSYAIRLNRPYHTPMNKMKGNNLSESLNSSSQVQLEAKNIRKRRQKYSVYSSSHFEGEELVESPKKGHESTDVIQLRQKKQQKKLKKLKQYQEASRTPMPYQQTQETRMSLNKRYDGGNIKFGKSSRFNSAESQQIISKKGSKSQIPGPGHYEVKSIFDRHLLREP